MDRLPLVGPAETQLNRIASPCHNEVAPRRSWFRRVTVMASLSLLLAAAACSSSTGDPALDASEGKSDIEQRQPDSAAPDSTSVDISGVDVEDQAAPDYYPYDYTTVPEFDIMINEVRCKDGDFIELYNTSNTETVPLEGWVVADGDDATHRYTLPDDLELGPGAFLAVPVLSAKSGGWGFPFGLACGDDTVSLYNPEGQLADRVVLPQLPAGQTWGRIPDGTGVWQATAPTPNGANQPTRSLDEVLFSLDRVVQIDLTLPPESYAALEAEPKVYVAGKAYLSSGDFQFGPVDVGIRLKGNWGSFRPLSQKASFKVKFSHVNPMGRLLGKSHMTLNAMVSDPGMIREVVSYRLFAAFGLPAPRAGYAWVRLNGEEYGLYANIEAFDDMWLANTFTTTQHLYEGGYSSDFEPGMEWAFEVDEGDETDLSDLSGFMTSVAQSSTDTFVDDVGSVLDLEGFAKLMALEHFMGHWDGYAVAINNFYIHFAEAPEKAEMIPWGTDQLFRQHHPYYFGNGILFKKCVESEDCRAIYDSVLLEMIDLVKQFDLAGLAASTAASVQEQIQADPRKPYTLQEAEAGLEEDISYIEWKSAALDKLEECILTPELFDTDGDGRVCDMDCLEGNPQAYVGAPEICDDMVDNDCNGLVDDGPQCPDCKTITIAAHDYALCLSPRNFDDAKKSCAQLGMVPVTLNTPEEERWVRGMLSAYGLTIAWLGLVRSPTTGEFGWFDQTPLEWSSWEPGEPDGQPGDRDCSQMFTWKQWADASCFTTSPVICEAPCDTFVDSDGDGYLSCIEDCYDTVAGWNPGAKDLSGECADGVDQNCNFIVDDGAQCVPPASFTLPGVPGWQFFFLDQPSQRDAARMECAALGLGADLAWFDSLEENQAASAALQVLAPSAVVWIGLNDLAEEGWYLWANGSAPKYTNWATGQPNNWDDSEDCGRMLPDGTWNDTNCKDALKALCRKPAPVSP